MTTEIRNLSAAKTLAALHANSIVSDKELQSIPAALYASKSYTLPLHCSRTGLVMGSLNVATVAGHMPVVSQWRDSMILHPLFSLGHVALLHFAKNTWFRFCSFSPEEGADERITSKQEETLQVTALAMLYHLTEIRQDIPWLPDWQEVAAHWPSLMAISYWKAYLDSARFRFPHIHISRVEGTFNFKDYLQTCWQVKKSYETAVNEKVEIEKLAAANAAQLALREMLAGVRPTSNKQIWRWFLAHLPKRYSKDADTWMKEIFFSKGEEIREFTIADIDLLEQIFLCETPTGSSISHAFSEVIASKRKYLQEHFETFEIIIPSYVQEKKDAGEIPTVEPQPKDYPTKFAYIKARAEWRLAHTDIGAKMKAAANKQATVSVKASYVPELPAFLQQDVVDEDGSEEDDNLQLDGIDAAERDDTITGEMENE